MTGKMTPESRIQGLKACERQAKVLQVGATSAMDVDLDLECNGGT